MSGSSGHGAGAVSLPDEVWRPARGFPSYEVSNLGRVRRATPGPGTEPGRILATPWNATRGRVCVTLSENAERTNTLLHILVLEAFRGRRPPSMETRFRDGNPRNCTLANLHWAPIGWRYVATAKVDATTQAE